MPTVTRTVSTPAPLDVVRSYLRDFENAAEWDAGTVSCEAVQPSTPVGVGEQWTDVPELCCACCVIAEFGSIPIFRYDSSESVDATSVGWSVPPAGL